MSKRQIDIFRDNLKTKVMGMFLDRSTYAVIEPDARTRSFMKGGHMQELFGVKQQDLYFNLKRFL